MSWPLLLIGIIGGGVAAVIGLAKFDGTHRLSAAILLTLAICGLHFTGMAGASIMPDPTVPVPAQAISPIALAIAVTAVTLMILCFSLAGSILDEHLVSRSAKEAERLAASEARFRQLTEADLRRHPDAPGRPHRRHQPRDGRAHGHVPRNR